MKNHEPPPLGGEKDARQKRLAAALRANLKRRKSAVAKPSAEVPAAASPRRTPDKESEGGGDA